jgi:predicted nucleic acid-binding protein
MTLIYIDTSFILGILLETEKSDLAEQLLEAHRDDINADNPETLLL